MADQKNDLTATKKKISNNLVAQFVKIRKWLFIRNKLD